MKACVLLLLLPALALAQPVSNNCQSPSATCKAKNFVINTGGSLLPPADLGASLGSATKRFLTLYAQSLRDGNSVNRMLFVSAQGTIYTSAVADGATAVGHIFNMTNTLTTSGAALACFYNGGASKQLCIDKDGKILGVFGATPQFIDMAYGSNGIQLRTGSAGGGDITFSDAGGNLMLHSSVSQITQGSVENPVPVVHQAQTGSAVAIEFGRTAASAGGALAVSFATAFASAPSCRCTDENAVPVVCGITTAPSVSAVTFSVTVARADTLDWMCIGAK